jgi:hypothetical protein
MHLFEDWRSNVSKEVERKGHIERVVCSRLKVEKAMARRTLVDVGAVCLLAGLGALLLLTTSSGCLLAGFLLLGWCFAGWGLATSGWGLLSCFWGHFEGIWDGKVRMEVGCDCVR